MAKGQFGARHLQKHLWKLPIPEFDPTQGLHVAIAEAGATAADGAGEKLAELREKRTDKLTGTIVRRELRTWLRTSEAGESCGNCGGQTASRWLGAPGVAVAVFHMFTSHPTRRKGKCGLINPNSSWWHSSEPDEPVHSEGWTGRHS